MKAIILAAGFGTRLYPLTKNKSKALLQVGGVPLVNWIISNLEFCPEIEEIIIVSNDRFYDDFLIWKTEYDFRKPIRIVNNEASSILGQRGAVLDLSFGVNQAGDSSRFGYLILASDNFYDFELDSFVKACIQDPSKPRIGIYKLKEKESARYFGSVEIDRKTGKITHFEEKAEKPKTGTVSVGVYYLPLTISFRLKEYLELEGNNPDRIGDFIGWLSKKKNVYTYEFRGNWLDIGTVDELVKLRRRFLENPNLGANLRDITDEIRRELGPKKMKGKIQTQVQFRKSKIPGNVNSITLKSRP